MKHYLGCVLCTAFCVLPLVSLGQEAWPSKPIKVIVPFGPGSAADASGRAVVDLLSKQLGQPIIVENRVGAGGTIGAGAVAKAAPDGYTLLIHSNSHTVTASTYTLAQMGYDPARDLVGVASLALTPSVFVTATSKGFATMQAMIDHAKSKPDSINYASAGVGSVTHLGAERLKVAGNFTGTHIPTKSTPEAMTEVLSGRADYFMSPIGLAAPHIKAGKLVALGVSSSKRSNVLPNVPTTAEAGVVNAEYDTWMGMYAPAKTPRDILERLNREVAKVLRSLELQARYETIVMTPLIMSVDEFAVYLKKDFEMNAQLVKQAGLSPN
ncbi:MAG: tripartite tricarboxylate transporter substrate binding protein [Limnohabitans sp.]|nr:tripartite tricarboxylate transporter substrate binding protein [Limnohabitans sp.]